jgi:hypothetical protein
VQRESGNNCEFKKNLQIIISRRENKKVAQSKSEPRKWLPQLWERVNKKYAPSKIISELELSYMTHMYFLEFLKD